jgi:predicted esterase
MTRVVAVLLGLVWVAAAAAGGVAGPPSDLFTLPGDRVKRAVVTLGEGADASPSGEKSSAMLRALGGIVAELSPREVGMLAATPEPGGQLPDARGELQRVSVVHLTGASSSRRIEILLRSDGQYIARMLLDGTADALGDPGAQVVRLNHDRFSDASEGWPAYCAGFGEGFARTAGLVPEQQISAGTVVELERPYTPSRFIMDEEGLGDRFLRGQKSNLKMTRALSESRFFARLPAGYDPKRPAGLLVWVDAGREGRSPEVFAPALDELGIICIGAADSGNLREVADRYQLALDAVATATRRFHVDPRRVYVSGISGGGRVSSALCFCFPDLFTGAVPIVGLGCYERVPMGNSAYAASICLPPPSKRFALLRDHRIAAMTGDEDANQREIRAAAEVMNKDGVRVRVFDYADMRHELPTPARFTDALKWVDEPYQELRRKEAEAAQKLLDGYQKRAGERGPANARERQELMKVTEAGPWTEAAWKAVGLLGVARTAETPR